MRFRCSPQHMKPFVIIVDYKFYLENEKEITDWANRCTPGWVITGMVLEFKNEQDRMAFMLVWS